MGLGAVHLSPFFPACFSVGSQFQRFLSWSGLLGLFSPHPPALKRADLEGDPGRGQGGPFPVLEGVFLILKVSLGPFLVGV